MSVKISRELFSQFGKIIKEENRLEDLGNKGYKTTTDLFNHFYKDEFDRYDHNNDKHREIFRKLIKSLLEMSKEMDQEVKIENNLGYEGAYFHEAVWKQIENKLKK